MSGPGTSRRGRRSRLSCTSGDRAARAGRNLTCRDMVAWIECDGDPLEVYRVQVDEECAWVECFIESKIGQTFKIFVESFLTHKDAECFVYIDGQKITSMAIEAYGKEELAGLYEGRHRLRPFMFSVLPTTDDDQFLHRETEVGEIMLQIYTGTLTWNRDYEIGAYSSRKLLNKDPIHEEKKQLGMHKVALANERIDVVYDEDICDAADWTLVCDDHIDDTDNDNDGNYNDNDNDDNDSDNTGNGNDDNGSDDNDDNDDFFIDDGGGSKPYYATLVFKYRGREFLEKHKIVPLEDNGQQNVSARGSPEDTRVDVHTANESRERQPTTGRRSVSLEYVDEPTESTTVDFCNGEQDETSSRANSISCVPVAGPSGIPREHANATQNQHHNQPAFGASDISCATAERDEGLGKDGSTSAAAGPTGSLQVQTSPNSESRKRKRSGPATDACAPPRVKVEEDEGVTAAILAPIDDPSHASREMSTKSEVDENEILQLMEMQEANRRQQADFERHQAGMLKQQVEMQKRQKELNDRLEAMLGRRRIKREGASLAPADRMELVILEDGTIDLTA